MLLLLLLRAVVVAVALQPAATATIGCHSWPYINQTVCWPTEATTRWQCTALAGSAELAGGAVRWGRQRCTLISPPPWFTERPYRQPPKGLPASMWNASLWLVHNITLNVVTANLSAPGVRAVPGVADPATGTAPVPAIARYANNNATPGLLAGVNGGYFYRVHDTNFKDDVCIGKNRR
jgi:hypothetical protein